VGRSGRADSCCWNSLEIAEDETCARGPVGNHDLYTGGALGAFPARKLRVFQYAVS
jgi:hypothetical protein